MHPACPRFVTVVKIIQLLDNEVLAIVLSQLILKGFVLLIGELLFLVLRLWGGVCM